MLPDGTKALPEPILTHYQIIRFSGIHLWSIAVEMILKKSSSYLSLNAYLKIVHLNLQPSVPSYDDICIHPCINIVICFIGDGQFMEQFLLAQSICEDSTCHHHHRKPGRQWGKSSVGISWTMPLMIINSSQPGGTHFLTWLLIGWWLCHQPIRSQVWKCLSTSSDLDMEHS